MEWNERERDNEIRERKRKKLRDWLWREIVKWHLSEYDSLMPLSCLWLHDQVNEERDGRKTRGKEKEISLSFLSSSVFLSLFFTASFSLVHYFFQELMIPASVRLIRNGSLWVSHFFFFPSSSSCFKLFLVRFFFFFLIFCWCWWENDESMNVTWILILQVFTYLNLSLNS